MKVKNKHAQEMARLSIKSQIEKHGEVAYKERLKMISAKGIEAIKNKKIIEISNKQYETNSTSTP